MAEAIFNARAAGRAEARSAGTEPASAPHPEVLGALREIGLDASGPGRMLTQDDIVWADRIVSMGCSVEDACPAGWLGDMEDWALDDPKGRPGAEVRAIRDEIARRVDALLQEKSDTSQ